MNHADEVRACLECGRLVCVNDLSLSGICYDCLADFIRSAPSISKAVVA